MAYNFTDDEAHFRQFAKNLEQAIAKYGDRPPANRLQEQMGQLKRLIQLEKQFSKVLHKHKWGNSTFQAFFDYIIEDKRNLLAARPFFRERQAFFSERIAKVIKKRSVTGLKPFRINYEFVQFVLSQHKWAPNSPIRKIAREIEQLRAELLEQNMPLAISQCRVFWANSSQDHLSYMDLIQIHAQGLLNGIDKFVPPPPGLSKEEELQAYRKFRAVAIGRMIGDRISETNSTLIHFWPSDKRKIYRANKARRRFGDNFELIAEYVNEDCKDRSQLTTAKEVQELLSAVTTVSGETTVTSNDEGEGSEETILDQYASNEDMRPDNLVEENDAIMAMRAKYSTLTMLERKALRMKGIPA